MSPVTCSVYCHVSRVTCNLAAPGHGPQHQGPGARRHAPGGGAGAGARPRGQVGVTCHVSRVTCHNSSVLVADDDVDINTADTRGHTPLIIGELQLVVLYN